MSIKSDRWIQRMAEEHGMIEPFVGNQIRHNENGRIISYGPSHSGSNGVTFTIMPQRA